MTNQETYKKRSETRHNSLLPNSSWLGSFGRPIKKRSETSHDGPLPDSLCPSYCASYDPSPLRQNVTYCGIRPIRHLSKFTRKLEVSMPNTARVIISHLCKMPPRTRSITRRQEIIEDGWRAFLEWATRIAYRELLHVTQLNFVLPRLPLSLTHGGWKYTIPRPSRILDREDYYDDMIPWTDRLGYEPRTLYIAYPVYNYQH